VAGIYVHIPFCKKRCFYCDFYSIVNLDSIKTLVDALEKEIVLQKGYFSGKNQEITTIYFGGGTPSLLSIDQLSGIFAKIKANYNISADAEVTIEVNPDDTNIEYYKLLRNLGFNRVSIGIQSFDDHFLKLMNRRHTAKESIQSIENAQRAGFNNISIDLIYGLPGMQIDIWNANLNLAFEQPITHLSAYHLGIEEHTVFYNWMKKGKLRPIDEELSFHQFMLLNETAKTKGFEHYEISNLAKVGYRSRHNSAYWHHIPYLGFGPSAHMYNGEVRRWNVSNAKSYTECIFNNAKYWESETLSQNEKINEYIMIRLRTEEGILMEEFARLFGESESLELLKTVKPYIENKDAKFNNNILQLTLKGWFLSDRIISDLMVIIEK